MTAMIRSSNISKCGRCQVNSRLIGASTGRGVVVMMKSRIGRVEIVGASQFVDHNR